MTNHNDVMTNRIVQHNNHFDNMVSRLHDTGYEAENNGGLVGMVRRLFN